MGAPSGPPGAPPHPVAPPPPPGLGPALPVDPLYVPEEGSGSGRGSLPLLDAGRSPDPSVCPFLRLDAGGRLLAPSSRAGADHVCVAIGAARPQSMRQQELMCLRASHADCPRYLKGSLSPVAPGQARSNRAMPGATLAALLVLVLSAGISFGFVVQRGGIAMPSRPPDASLPVALATDGAGTAASPAPAEVASPGSSAGAEESISTPPSPSVAPTPQPTPAPTLAPTPTVAPTSEPTVAPTPRPTRTPRSDRYALLVRCPDRKGCWIYTVRSGDNLYSIANYFGHSLTTIYQWNPQYPGTPLRKGAEIRMPPPTR